MLFLYCIKLQLFDIECFIGLYGRNGIMPISSLMQSIKDELKSKTAESLFMNTPTLLWFMPLDPDVGLELLAILGKCVRCIMLFQKNIFVIYN